MMEWLKKLVRFFIRFVKPNRPKKFHCHVYTVQFYFKGESVMKHVVRLSWVESVGTEDFPIVSQHLKVNVGEVGLVDTDVPVGTNVFDFVCDGDVDVHCELVAANSALVSDPAVLDFHAPAFPPVPTKPDAPTGLAVEFIGTEE